MVQKSRLMRAVTSGLSTGGSLALAFKLLNWAEKADYLSPIVHPLGHWRFDCPSFVLGLLCGIALFLFIEAWVTLRWAVVSWLERPVDRLVADLREEIGDLRAELAQLRREVRELRREYRADSRASADSRLESHAGSRTGYGSPTPSSTTRGGQQSPDPERDYSVVDSAPAASGSAPATPLTWIERENICDRIGEFISNSLQGLHRGTSHRDQIPLPSRLWLIVRDYQGQIYTPVKVVKSWTSCKALVKRPGGGECGDSIFVGLPSEREARRDRAMSVFRQPPWLSDRPPLVFAGGSVLSDYPVCLWVLDPEEGGTTSLQVIQICYLEGKVLVAVPFAVWHKAVNRRILPPSSLTRPTLIEVQAASADDRSVAEGDFYLKLWVGFLRDSYADQLEIFEECDCEFFFDEELQTRLPLAHALVEISQEHFAFFSADGTDGAPLTASEQMAAGLEDEEELADAGSPTAKRLQRLEETMVDISSQLKQMVKPKASAAGPKRKAKGKASAPLKAKEKAAGGTTSPGDLRGQFPLLDGGVAQAALQAGIPRSSLEQMQHLMMRGKPGAQMKDLNSKVQPDPLSEDEPTAGEDMPDPDAAGFAEPRDPVSSTLDKLAAIVEILTEDRKKKQAASRLDAALDGTYATSSDAPLTGAGKKAAAARRALMAAYDDQPHEISNLIERQMFEDLNCLTLGPGMAAKGLNARAWVEFRSKVSNYRTSVYSSWSVAGILDSLISGNVAKARARACVLLLMLDQASIDKGSWTLAGELALEPPPPFSSFSQHQAPAIHDGESPFSKLLDPRWAELAMTHLKDTEDYLSKRRALGRPGTVKPKDGMGEEGAEGETRRRAKPKPKPKAPALGSGES
ncbi:unnamed protein product [Cladocopium goreaui]|uniref:Uncharacterized protein n=1 Tax=Cladocopium goreaui TaxID=2562237 RepID=A0A9P1FSA6_9DINO|nr:unnamed protein product [Cladocopium goreaui]